MFVKYPTYERKAHQAIPLLKKQYMTADELAQALQVNRSVLCNYIIPTARAIGYKIARRGQGEFLAYVLTDYYRKD